jgi:hypothetical protein
VGSLGSTAVNRLTEIVVVRKIGGSGTPPIVPTLSAVTG